MCPPPHPHLSVRACVYPPLFHFSSFLPRARAFDGGRGAAPRAARAPQLRASTVGARGARFFPSGLRRAAREGVLKWRWGGGWGPAERARAPGQGVVACGCLREGVAGRREPPRACERETPNNGGGGGPGPPTFPTLSSKKQSLPPPLPRPAGRVRAFLSPSPPCARSSPSFSLPPRAPDCPRPLSCFQ